MISYWEIFELQLLILLPKLAGENYFKKLVCSERWEEHIIGAFERLEDDQDLVTICSAYLEGTNVISLSTTTTDRIMVVLGDLIQQSLKQASGNESIRKFALGLGLKSYLRYCHDFGRVHFDLLASLVNLAGHYGSMPLYLEAVLFYLQETHFDKRNVDFDPFIQHLVENLHSSHHILRKLTLLLLQTLLPQADCHGLDLVHIALEIEDSPLDLQSARRVSMNVRKLASQYRGESTHPWLQKAIPHYCFGILTFKLSQLWADAVVVLKEICETKVGEEAVLNLAFQWLEKSNSSVPANPSPPNRIQNAVLSNFQCSNLIKLEDLSQLDNAAIRNPTKHMREKFAICHQTLSRDVIGAAALALQVLAGIPHVAEKRSRRLVPIFLYCARGRLQEEEEVEDLEEFPHTEQALMIQNEDLLTVELSRKDRKALLDIFGQFNNPKVLYRSLDVFNSLRNLLTNGDVEIQKSALKAIFCWNLRSLQPYRENLMNLLDDERFKEEISSFLHDDDAIQSGHRPDLIPIILRILYGKMIAKAGTGTAKKGQIVKRKAVFRALSRLYKDELHDFVQIVLGPLANHDVVSDSHLIEEHITQERLTVRRQLGLVKMMKDMLENLGHQLEPFVRELVDALLHCLVRAMRQLSTTSSLDVTETPLQASSLKSLRQVGIQCLILMFQKFSAQDLEPYISTLFVELISPRLRKLAIESSQSVSGLLILFSTWASSITTVRFLAEYDSCLITSIVDCLEVPSAKEDVKKFVLEEILKKIVGNCSGKTLENRNLVQSLLNPNVEAILSRVGSLLRKTPSKELLGSAVELISMLAPLIEGSAHIGNLFEISIFLLNQPSHRVNPRSKGDLLRIVQHFLVLLDDSSAEKLSGLVLKSISSLFGYFKDRDNRSTLCQVLRVLAKRDIELEPITSLCVSLNSFSALRIDEPDFDERLRAFNTINETSYMDFSHKQWLPLLHNMLYFVKDTEEFAIRQNASFALRRFIENNRYDIENSMVVDSLRQILLPSLRKGMFDSSELVRTEYLAIIAHLIRHNPGWQEIGDMSVLLMNDDEEASFFSNILHIQQHRRLRALRRLTSDACQSKLSSTNVAHCLIPLIEHFVFNQADDESAHNLTAETVTTIGALCLSLEWSQFRALFRRYVGYIQSKPHLEKTIIRLLGVVTDALSQAAESRSKEVINMGSETIFEKDDTTGTVAFADHWRSKLSITMPKQQKFTDDLLKNMLPSLLKYLHDKDESTVSFRVPVAISTVKLLKLLPPELLKDRLPAVLTDVCNILRSRSQESRDLTRKTLVEISTLIGPRYFGFVLKELRSALGRGYQLHVLSFTVHAILVATSSIFQPGDLNYCIPQIVSVIMDDIFGVTGLEKDAEEYISKMKEVKSSKSYDSMELVSKTATVEEFVHLIRPVQNLLDQKVDLKMIKKIDELLRRIGAGLVRNEAIQDHEVLVFCHEVFRESSQNASSRNEKGPGVDPRTKRFLVTSKGANKTGNRGSTSSYRYKLSRFSLDVLRSVLHKHEVLQTPSNIAGFIPIISSALIQSNEEVSMSALRLLTTVIRVPLQGIDDNANMYITECVKIFKRSVSTHSELAQTALKLVSAILRERRTIEIKEKDLAYLIKRLIPDLEEPDRQGVIFNFIKAVLTRKVIITEVYQLLDAVAAIMVTNQTRGARDLARGVYFQFIMEYPQGKDRFSKQLSFLARNLCFKHQEGRQSVMEVIHLLFLKVGENMIQDVIDAFMVPLVMVMVNDESAACREMAGTLLRTSIERADPKKRQSFLTVLRTWLDQWDNPLLARVALQLYIMYLDMNVSSVKNELPLLQAHIAQTLKRGLADTDDADWELIFYALETFAKTSQTYPQPTFAASAGPLWASVCQCLWFPHAWVKLSAAKLLGTYFADYARNNANAAVLELPLRGSGDLLLKADEIVSITRASLAMLKLSTINEELARQSVRNLALLGRIMSKTSMLWQPKSQHQDIEDDGSDLDDGEEDDTLELNGKKTALHFIFERVSAIIRRGPVTTKAPSLTSLTASLQLIGTLATNLPLATLTPCLQTILLPLHNLTDTNIAAPFSPDEVFTTGYTALVSSARDIMSMLQKKLGPTEFIVQLSRVREGVKERREGRRMKRKIETVTEPEKTERAKVRKGEKRKEKRKERGRAHEGKRRGW